MSGIIGDNLGRSGGLIKAAAGGGKIGQVLHSTYVGRATSTSEALASEDMALQICPVATSSKILVIAECHIVAEGNRNCGIILKIDDTEETSIKPSAVTDQRLFWLTTGYNTATNVHYSVELRHCSGMYLHSPNTTSEVDYEIWCAPRGDGGAWYMNRGQLNGTDDAHSAAASSITLMEVLA